MPRKRPPVVLVFGILNIVFGSLGLLALLCGGAVLGIAYSVMVNPPPGTGLISPPTSMVYYMAGSLLAGLVLGLMLVVSGIGLLNMRPWARWLSIFYSIIAILISLAGVVINVVYVQPAMEQWNHDMLQRQMQIQRPGNPNVVVVPPAQNSVAVNVTTAILGGVIGMAYAIGLLIVMLLPSVAASFAQPAARDYRDRFEDEKSTRWDDPPRGYDDEDEERFQSRRDG